jgi:hypothetical protein
VGFGSLVGWQRYQAQGLVLEDGFEALRQQKPKIRKLLAQEEKGKKRRKGEREKKGEKEKKREEEPGGSM